jgi:hypothetical protein
MVVSGQPLSVAALLKKKNLCLADWMGHRYALDNLENKYISWSCRDSRTNSSSPVNSNYLSYVRKLLKNEFKRRWNAEVVACSEIKPQNVPGRTKGSH